MFTVYRCFIGDCADQVRAGQVVKHGTMSKVGPQSHIIWRGSKSLSKGLCRGGLISTELPLFGIERRLAMGVSRHTGPVLLSNSIGDVIC
eukprot:1681482-Amphidinium_carterae.1